MTCNDLSQRIVDYLYDELPAGQRAELDAHLSGCPRCRHEVESLGAARQSAREALAGPLAETPPPRVRQAVLEAARAAARSGEPARAAIAAPEPDGASAWQRLWSWVRRPWFAPAFVTVSAMVVFLVARGPLLDRPGRALDQAMQASSADEPATADPSKGSAGSGELEPVLEAAAPAEALSAAPEREARRARKAGGLDPATEGLRVAERPAGKASGFAQPPPPRPRASRPQAPARQKRVTARAVAPKKALLFDKEAPVADVETPAAASAPGDLDRAAPVRGAVPGARRRAELPQAPRAAPSNFIESPPTALEAAMAAPAAAADESEDEAQESDSIPRQVARAEAFFTQRRFGEAARIYADLIRRHPRHPDVDHWKKRRLAAETAARP